MEALANPMANGCFSYQWRNPSLYPDLCYYEKSLMGNYTNPKIFNWLAWAATIIMNILTIADARGGFKYLACFRKGTQLFG